MMDEIRPHNWFKGAAKDEAREAPTQWWFPDELKKKFSELIWKGKRGTSTFFLEVGDRKPARFLIEVDYRNPVPAVRVNVNELTRGGAGVTHSFMVYPQFRQEGVWPEEYHTVPMSREDTAMVQYLRSKYSVSREGLRPHDETCEECWGTGRVGDTNAVTGEDVEELCPSCFPGGYLENQVSYPLSVRLVFMSRKGRESYDLHPETLQFDRETANPGNLMYYLLEVAYAEHKEVLAAWNEQQKKEEDERG